MANKLQTARRPRFGFDRNSPIGRFWRWWSGELLELVPQRLRQSSGPAGNALLVEITSNSVVFRRWVSGKLIELGRTDLRAGDQAGQSVAFQALANKLRKRDDLVVLWLAEGQFLCKQVELPAATAENLQQVLSFEMDRHSPFKADQVYFDFRVVHKDVQRDRIDVKLALAPRLEVDSALDLLTRWGCPPQAVYVDAASAAGEPPLNLMPIERRSRKSSTLLWMNLGLLALAIFLVLAAIVVPIIQKRQQVIALLPIVEQAKQQAEATDALRREWEKRSAEYNFVLEKKAAVPPLVVQLDELSKLLPDDTWIQQFDLKGKELQLQGETASSSKLIGILESSRMLRDASFRSPLTKGLAANSERFHVAVTLKPITIEAPPAVPVPPPPMVPPAAGAAAAQAAASAATTASVPSATKLPAPPQVTKPEPVSDREAARLSHPPIPRPLSGNSAPPPIPAPGKIETKPGIARPVPAPAAPAASTPPAGAVGGKAPQARGSAQ